MEPLSTGNPRRKMARRTPSQIISLLTEYENSSLTADDFCEQYQIKRFNLTRWLRLYRKNRIPPKGFVAVSVAKEVEPLVQKDVLFAEYLGIRFYQPVDPTYFKALLS